MATAFTRTMRSLGADGFRRSVAGLMGAVALTRAVVLLAVSGAGLALRNQ